MAKWTVNQWTQVEWDGEWLTGGDTFEGDLERVRAEGLSQYVTPVPEEEKAAEPAPNKAQDSAPNKAKPASKRTTKQK